MMDVGAGWRPDPYRRHEQRYYDGARWTEHVIDQGAPGVDPTLAAPTPITPPPGMAPARGWDSVVRPKYRSLRGFSIALSWLLAFATLVCLLRAFAYFNRRSLLDDARSGVGFTVADGRRADDYVSAATQCTVVLGLAIFVVLIVFLFRASKNTDMWDRGEKQFGAGWTIGGWFIPIASFAIPFVVVREIWLRTPEDLTGRGRGAGTWSLWLWWVTWIGSNLLFLATRSSSRSSFDALILQDTWGMVGSVGLAVASFMLVLVVRDLERRQAQLGQPAPLPTGVS
jgi:hypothetical protein